MVLAVVSQKDQKWAFGHWICTDVANTKNSLRLALSSV